MGRKKKYQTEEERKAAQKERKKNWYEKHKEELREYYKERYAMNVNSIRQKNINYSHTIVGRAIKLRLKYINNDRKYGRIGKELPIDYVTVQDVVRLITKKCAHFDECGTYGWRKIGLNRLDNSLPHIKRNVEPCCVKCNRKWKLRQ